MSFTTCCIEGDNMKTTELTLADIGLIASTRGMLGAGLGLLISGKLGNEQRRAVGWTLVIVGIVTTVPLLLNVLAKQPQLASSRAYERLPASVV
jgi:hypothetical protein